ncbi:MAG: tetratricopeptide repeat protein [Verrucomicrobiota bacterium]
MLLLVGCDRTEKRFQQALETAKTAYESGSYPVVISNLDPYLTVFPDNLEIRTLLGLSHVRSGNPFEGAVLLAQAYRADSDLVHFAKEAGQAFQQVGDSDSAIEAYRAYLDIFNDDAQAKLSLAELVLSKGRRSEALSLMLEAEKQAPQSITPNRSLTLGELFLSQGNTVQARRYFSRLERDPDFGISLPAQLSLIRIAASETDWPEVESRIANMDSQLPGAFDSSDLAPLRQQIEDWNAAKLAMEAERKRQEEAAALAEQELANQAEQANSETATDTDTEAVPTIEDTRIETAETSETAPLEAIPAPEEAQPNPESNAPEQTAPLPPVEPLSDSDLLATDLSPADSDLPADLSISQENLEPTEPGISKFEIAILKGDAALAENNPDAAIDAYYDAQSYEPENARVWEKLADAYQLQEESRKAEIALLEAMRHAPEEISLRIRYLRFVQTLGDSAKLMRSIQEAKERFPEDATITLLLARAYERIEQNDRVARFYYNQFLQLAPNDPQAEAVRQKLLGR